MDHGTLDPAAGRARVLILGTGAMAKLLGARLARTGRAAVLLAGTWRAAVDAIAARGITVEEPGVGGTWTVAVGIRAVTLDAVPGTGGSGDGFDLVLVLVKAHQTPAVTTVAARAVAPGGLVITLQNGLGHLEALVAGGVPESQVVVGVTAAGASAGDAPDRVRAGGPGWTVLGVGAARRAAVEGAADRLRAAGFDTTVEADVAAPLWRKLAVNCAINPLTALLSVPNGELLARPGARATLAAAAREVGQVAAALGIDIGADPAALAVEVARNTAANRSSMLQDVERGAPTEVDAITGAVVRHGRRLGVPTPVNADLWRRVRALDAARAAGHVAGPTGAPTAAIEERSVERQPAARPERAVTPRPTKAEAAPSSPTVGPHARRPVPAAPAIRPSRTG